MVLYLRIMWTSFIPSEDSDTFSDFFHVFWRNCCGSFYLSEGFCIQHPCSSPGWMDIVFYHEMLSDHSSSVMESSLRSVIRLRLERKETAYQRLRLSKKCSSICMRSCGSVVEHCVSSAKGHGFNSQGTHILTKKIITWRQCKSLWIKASAKCIHVNMYIH